MVLHPAGQTVWDVVSRMDRAELDSPSSLREVARKSSTRGPGINYRLGNLCELLRSRGS